MGGKLSANPPPERSATHRERAARRDDDPVPPSVRASAFRRTPAAPFPFIPCGGRQAARVHLPAQPAKWRLFSARYSILQKKYMYGTLNKVYLQKKF